MKNSSLMNQTSKTMRQKESAGTENEDIYKILFDNVHDGIYRSTPEGKILTANPALIKMLGYDSEDELKQLNISTDLYVNPADRDLFISRILQKGVLNDVELKLKRKDGRNITVLENSYPVYDANGKILYFEGTLIDITSRKNAEEALRESENRYHTLVETIQDGLSLFDLQGRLSYINRRKREMLGYDSDDEIMKVNTFEMIHPDDRGMAVEFFEEILHKGSLRDKEIRILRKDGSWFRAELCANLITGSEGQPLYIMDTMRDITDRRRAEEEIRLRLRQLRQIMDLVPAYIFAKDMEGRFLLANKALADLFGLSPEEIEGKTDRDYGASEEQVEWYRKFDLEVIRKGKPVFIPEEKVLRRDGSEGWFQTVKIPYMHPGYDKPAVLGVATDITDRKKTEDYLRQSEERFRKLFEAHSSVMLIIEPGSGRIVDANRSASDFYGYSCEDLKHMTIFNINEASNAKVNSLMSQVVREGEINFEAIHRLADGTKKEVEVFSTRIETGGKAYLYSIIHDITEKKKIHSDLVTAKEKAEESDRLKTAFLHNISHEIRTPMNSIVGFASLLASEGGLDETNRNYAELIVQSSKQLLSIISDIVEISNIETGRVKVEISEVSLNRVLDNLALQYSLKADQSGIVFKTKFQAGEHSVMTDETKLVQIITNLLNNAFKFTPAGGLIEFEFEKLPGYASFSVKDTGPGIPEEYREKIFERFFQIMKKGTNKTEGTGLGLAISKAYAELLNGEILLRSETGKGSEFILKIPLSNGKNPGLKNFVL